MHRIHNTYNYNVFIFYSLSLLSLLLFYPAYSIENKYFSLNHELKTLYNKEQKYLYNKNNRNELQNYLDKLANNPHKNFQNLNDYKPFTISLYNKLEDIIKKNIQWAVIENINSRFACLDSRIVFYCYRSNNYKKYQTIKARAIKEAAYSLTKLIIQYNKDKKLQFIYSKL